MHKLYNSLSKKLVVSKDIVFNNEEAWNLSKEETTQEQHVVNELDKPPQEVPSQVTPPSPQHVTLSSARNHSSSGVGSRSESTVQRGPIIKRSLREIYEQIEENGETNLVFLLIMSFSLSKRLRKKIVGEHNGVDSCHPEE